MAIRAREWICGTVKGNVFNNLSIYLEFAVRGNKRCKSMWKALSKRHKGWRSLRKRKKTCGRDLNRWGSWTNKREEVLSTAEWDKGGVKALWLTGGPKTGDIAYSHSMSQPVREIQWERGRQGECGGIAGNLEPLLVNQQAVTSISFTYCCLTDVMRGAI